MDEEMARTRVLDAAEELFYARGIQAVGMDEIRDASGVPLKRLYQLFPGKAQLVAGYLERRDVRWRQRLALHVEAHGDPEDRILAVFDWLREWFTEPGFRGCAWINSYGELGATSVTVTLQARAHKEAFQRYLRDLTTAAALSADLADQLYLLAEGAMVTAAIFASPLPAAQARAAARVLIDAARSS